MPPAPATTREHGDERRRLILRAALTVIGRDGITGTTHRVVAREADVPLGSLTYYFASKGDLLRGALLLFVDDELRRLEAVPRALAGRRATPERIVDAFTATLTADRAHTLAQYELYLHAARDPLIADGVRRCVAAYTELVQAVLRAAGAPDDEATARAVVALVDGLGLHGLGEARPLPSIRAAMLALLGPLLRAHPG